MKTTQNADKNERFYNLNLVEFVGEGYFGMPVIEPAQYTPVDEWISFNDVLRLKGDKKKTGVHFFLDDYRIERVWNNPRRYAEKLKDFAVVLSPDFSLYMNTPPAIQVFSHYRKQWCGAYWQKVFGANVVPTICWSDEDSFIWCFDGVPRGSAVAVSSVGVKRHRETRENFLKGYKAMKERLTPTAILHYGKPIEEIADEVIEIEAFQEKFTRLRSEG